MRLFLAFCVGIDLLHPSFRFGNDASLITSGICQPHVLLIASYLIGSPTGITGSPLQQQPSKDNVIPTPIPNATQFLRSEIRQELQLFIDNFKALLPRNNSNRVVIK